MAKSKPAIPVEPETRLARVRAILNAAASDSQADYDGLGRFWEKGIAEFVGVRVHGVPMIAPKPPSSSCCHSESRSASSGLIKGLRGQAPFDGNQFPPLPWGGKRVDEVDICFIADWIDAGCPGDDDHHRSIAVTALKETPEDIRRIRVGDVAEFEAFAPGPKTHAYREGELRQRPNLDCLSEPQVREYGDAFRRIYDINHRVEDRRNYNNQALIHQNHCQHGWERFLPWHRAYLYEFEQNLQDFSAGIMVPYWDWTMPQYQPDDPASGWIIPEAFKAFLSEEQADVLIGTLDPKPTPKAADSLRKIARDRRLFVSQHEFFCYLITETGYADIAPDPANPNRCRLIDALLASNPLWYPLRYPAEYGGKTINEAIQYHYPTGQDMVQILSLNNFRDFGGGSVYDAAFGFLDQNPHNTMHIWTGGKNPDVDRSGNPLKSYACGDSSEGAASGPLISAAHRNLATVVAGRSFHRREDLYSQPPLGDMFSNLTASYDPIFWPIHVNVDRVWWEWQKRNPNGTPADLDAVLSPWSYTVRDMLDISRFGYEYVRSAFFMPVGMEAPIARFVSKPIKVDSKVKSFRKAEIRLHWVPQLQRSCFVRAFLNQAGADATTPLRNNPHYAGYLAIFGHGECYGGPGHCDLPPPRARAHDLRPRSHNTPRNHRLDVTEAAKRLLATSHELQITLVIVGVDYREERDLLKLEGVSINFLD
jgi:tyrosinase